VLTSKVLQVSLSLRWNSKSSKLLFLQWMQVLKRRPLIRKKWLISMTLTRRKKISWTKSIIWTKPSRMTTEIWIRMISLIKRPKRSKSLRKSPTGQQARMKCLRSGTNLPKYKLSWRTTFTSRTMTPNKLKKMKTKNNSWKQRGKLTNWRAGTTSPKMSKSNLIQMMKTRWSLRCNHTTL